ncbi:MAG: hypothetical protein AAF985_01660 [Bacteroidota bacterium]
MEDHVGLVDEQYNIIVPFMYEGIRRLKRGNDDAYAKVEVGGGLCLKIY